MRRSDYFVNWRAACAAPRGALGPRGMARAAAEATATKPLDLLLDEARFGVEEGGDGDGGDIKI